MSDLRLCHTNFHALLSNSLHYFTKTPILFHHRQIKIENQNCYQTKTLEVEKLPLKFDSKIDLEKTKRQTLLNSLLLPCWHFAMLAFFERKDINQSYTHLDNCTRIVH